MKQFLLSSCIALLSICSYAHTNETRSSHITWLTDHDEAIKTSRASSKPLIILFTGSDWCSWCIKLEEEALNTPEFAEAVADRFVFLKLDFPINSTLPPDRIAQNKQLKKRYDITGFPTIVVLDPQQQVIGNTGYRAGGGKQYAAHLLKMTEDHADYKQKVQQIDKQSFSGTDLKHLYDHATECGHNAEASQIALLGIGSDQKHFFSLERYRLLAEEGKIRTPEAQSIRQQLLADDPNNIKLTYYQVAVIDFEASCKEANNNAPEITVASLVNYIEKFGDKDKENLWRLEMIISQVYFDKDKLPEALRYAQSSYQSAPQTAQPQIAAAIKNIQSKMHQ